MSVNSAIPMLRAFADSLMQDTVVITRPVEGGTLDPDTGIFIPIPATTVYTGPCRVHFPTPSEQSAIFGETEVTRTRAVISLPWDAPEIEVDDIAIVHGRVFTVVATPPPSTFNMRRQIGCEIDE